ncbi:MAG: hypothetical protein JL56_05935 [Desulfotomaculum sp. BICA1-6]|nr:MAG: hypothetical protein JL56_05935 [Desulfotomaculum sp. BICA1-6]
MLSGSCHALFYGVLNLPGVFYMLHNIRPYSVFNLVSPDQLGITSLTRTVIYRPAAPVIYPALFGVAGTAHIGPAAVATKY